MVWTVEFHAEFTNDFNGLDEAIQNEILAHARLLATCGPTLGRPRVDTLKGSKIANLKELRFSAGGGVWRVAFAFDKGRAAGGWRQGRPKGRSVLHEANSLGRTAFYGLVHA